MAFLRNVTRGFHSLFQKESVERELDEELREFVDANAAEKMRSGMGRERAYREAKMGIGRDGSGEGKRARGNVGIMD